MNVRIFFTNAFEMNNQYSNLQVGYQSTLLTSAACSVIFSLRDSYHGFESGTIGHEVSESEILKA